jgi:hypothetical protein
MRLAFWFTSTFGAQLVDDAGQLVGEHSGMQLLKRLMRQFERPILLTLDSGLAADYEWGSVRTPGQLDVNNTMVVSFDPLLTPWLYQELRPSPFRYPKLLNLIWFNESELTDERSRQQLAHSTAQFTTLCNSKRTHAQALAGVRKWCSPAAFRDARVAWQNLGIENDRVQWPTHGVEATSGPTVQYPAMWLFARKQPEKFEVIVRGVEQRTPLNVRVRLAEKALGHEIAERWRGYSWSVQPPAPRAQYWDGLTMAQLFVATAQDESYGLNYLEQLASGQIGLFPKNRPWPSSILPEDYPYRYSSTAEAVEMLFWAATHVDEAWQPIRELPTWIRENHDAGRFDAWFKRMVEETFTVEGKR